MKKTMKFIGLIAMAAVLFSCEKKNIDTPVKNPQETETPSDLSQLDPSKYLLSFGATIEDPYTKATIDTENGTIAFEDGDEVLVVAGEKTGTYVYGSSAFSPKAETDAVPTGSGDICAYYPATAYTASSGDVTFKIPGGADNTTTLGDKNPMAATLVISEGTASATFTNFCSILQVSITGNRTLEKVSLNNASKAIAQNSEYSVTWSEGVPSIATEATDKKAIEISSSAPLKSTTPTVFYFILPAGTNLSGVSVTAYTTTPDNGEMYTYTISRGDWTPKKNQIYQMSFYAGLFSGGTGTSGDPYIIANARDFKHIDTYCTSGYGSLAAADFLGAYYKQTVDIDFKNASLTPIGTTDSPFTGVYDGNSKKLENVSISTTANDTGLFAYLDNATVKDITVTGSIETSKSNVGSISGRANGASILRCVNLATVKSTAASNINAAVGGIVGQANQTDPVTIESCVNEGVVSGAIFLGGIVGDIKGNVDKCVNKANVIGSSSNVGGIAGSLRGNSIVKRCYSSKEVEVRGTNRVGGIVGVVNSGDDQANTTWIVNCFTNSNVTGTSNTSNYGVGGIVGYLTKGILANGATGDITVKCSASCTNKSNAKVYVGGIVGYLAQDGTVQNVYSPLYAKDIKIGSIHGRSGSGKIGQIVGYTAGTLIGYYFGGCAAATTGWQYWGTNSSSTTSAQFAITTANNVSFDWTKPVQKDFTVEEWTVSLNAGEYYMSDLMNVAIDQDPLASQYTKADGEVLTWAPIDGTNTTDTHPIPNALIALGEDYYKN